MIAQRYEELDAWQLANELKQKVYALVDESAARNDFKFRDQIRDSAASATSNLAEGFGYFRHPEFAKHTRIAKASLHETHNHLGDGVDRKHWSTSAANPLQKLAERAIGACSGLCAYLEGTDTPKRHPRKQRNVKGTSDPAG